MRTRSRARETLFSGALLLAVASTAGAQERTCDLVESRRVEQTERGGVAILEFLDPFVFRCTDGTVLSADRGLLDQGSRWLELHGNVYFEDPIRTLTADDATYESALGRLHATGNVEFVDRQEGSTIRGPELEYFRPVEGRPQPRVNAHQRPHLTLQPREGGEDAEPLEVDADDVTIVGQDQLEARGSVVITRTDLRATAREAWYTGATGGLELRGEARIESGEYDLAGEVVRATLVDGALQHVHAQVYASLSGEDLTVTAPDLQLFFADELLQRAVARVDEPGGEVRAVATSRTFRLEADSIDALVPGQRVEQVVAIGSARGESIDTTGVQDAPVDAAPADLAPDTAAADTAANPPPRLAPGMGGRSLIATDWIRGDTIIGYFAAAEPAPAAADTAADRAAVPADVRADTTGALAAGERADTAVVLERIVARGSALSLYRVEREGASAGAARRINFLAGETIELTFAAGELDTAEVDGLQRGIFLDPVVPAAAPPTEQTAPRTGGQ